MRIFDKLKVKKKEIILDNETLKEKFILNENVLYLTRFCGVEQYPVKTATWHIIEGDGTEDDPAMLCINIRFGVGNDLHKDTATLAAEPIWEIKFYPVEISASSLQPGFYLEQPNLRKDVDGSLYYVEHQPTTNNRMEIMKVDETRLKIRLTGITEDVNFYDRSKPESTMQLVAWFDRK